MRDYTFFRAGSPNVSVTYRVDQFGSNRNNMTVMQIRGLDTVTEQNEFSAFKQLVFTEESFINHATTYNLTLVSRNSNGGEESLLKVGQLTISTTSPMDAGTEAVPYDEDVEATGGTGNYVFTLVSGTLPIGTTLSSGGTIAGTPTTANTYNFTVRVDDLGTGAFTTKALQIVIAGA